MSAGINLYGPGITGEDAEDDICFRNDCAAWASLVCEMHVDSGLMSLLERLGCGALATHTTDGMDDQQVQWVSPAELAAAATTLSDLVAARDPRVEPVLAAYEKDANGIDPVDQELRQDLRDIVQAMKFVQERGITKVTLAINW